LKLLSQLSRITTAGRTFIPQIDGLRFIAIMAVIAYHVRGIGTYHLRYSPNGSMVEGDLVNDIFSTGHLGVMLFFAISGFILSLPFARCWRAGERPVNLRSYYFRRVTRIEPPYVIHLIFLFLFCALVLRYQPTHQGYFGHSGWLDYSAKHILASLFYSNGFIYAAHPYPNSVLWSLEVEVQFYLLAPLLAQVFKIDQAWLRRGLLVAGIGLLPVAGVQIACWVGNPYLAGYSLMGNLQFFLVGFLLADWQATARVPASRHLLWDMLLILDCFVLVYFRNSGWMFSALPIIIGIITVAAFKGSLTFRALGNPWVTTIGGMCYTIYMYHSLMISVLIRPAIHVRTHILWLDLLIYFVLMSAVIVPVCAVLFFLFERPFMRSDWPAKFREKVLGAPQLEKVTTGSTTPL
jgi:peptidoglycan/LPS O-acetylase OafA/YrhL